MNTTASGMPPTGSGPALGLRQNLAQFLLLVGVNALVGGMLGQERVVLPLMAEREFGVSSLSTMLTFIAAFGLTKAATNLLAGTLADRYGRKPVLTAGWLVGVTVPLVLLWAPSWGWVIAANVLLGVNQGLTWSVTVIMKIDLVGPSRRGLAMGLNEAAGYGAVAVMAWATGALAAAHGLRPAPFLLGLAVAGVGLGVSALFVRETAGHVALESPSATGLGMRDVLALGTWRDRSLSSASQAGLVNNLNEGLAWGLFPVFFAASGLGLAQVAALSALTPAVWSVGQLATGALSDRIGRKPLIVAGQWTQAAALAGIALSDTWPAWALGAALLGAGTAMAYPTLLAAVGDVAAPSWRGAAIGVYRLWRDVGFALGALAGGVLGDAFSPATAVLAVAAVTALSGADVALRMAETHPRAQR